MANMPHKHCACKGLQSHSMQPLRPLEQALHKRRVETRRAGCGIDRHGTLCWEAGKTCPCRRCGVLEWRQRCKGSRRSPMTMSHWTIWGHHRVQRRRRSKVCLAPSILTLKSMDTALTWPAGCRIRGGGNHFWCDNTSLRHGDGNMRRYCIFALHETAWPLKEALLRFISAFAAVVVVLPPDPSKSFRR